MDFVKGGIKKGKNMQEFENIFYLEAQTLISLKAASFIDANSALLNTVQPNKNLSLTFKSGIYGAHNVSELICHLLTFKDNFEESGISSPLSVVLTHTPDLNTRLSDLEDQPALCYPDKEEIEEDQLHRVLAFNALTQGQRVRKEPFLATEPQDTVALPYTKQLSLPSTEVIHESDSAKKLLQFLKSVNVSASL
ncbi:hypothetical protein DSO57_1009706 [Entomophthora muscae]|uniref:Uncharacterized protein n=1 Tax=Entomophthora muscae TaxID=34485 RepID=A0ACC2UGI8_9FUNG|nr:hypothetical protein DSO57_1009706 [Entomophthora muscae]